MRLAFLDRTLGRPGRRAIARRVVVLSPLGLALVGATCGREATPVLQAYVDALESLRADFASEDEAASQEFNRLRRERSRDPAPFVAVFESFRRSNAALLARLQDVRPPESLAGLHAELARGLEGLVAGLDATLTALASPGPDALTAALTTYQAAATRSQTRQVGAMLEIRRAARAAGARP